MQHRDGAGLSFIISKTNTPACGAWLWDERECLPSRLWHPHRHTSAHSRRTWVDVVRGEPLTYRKACKVETGFCVWIRPQQSLLCADSEPNAAAGGCRAALTFCRPCNIHVESMWLIRCTLNTWQPESIMWQKGFSSSNSLQSRFKPNNAYNH